MSPCVPKLMDKKIFNIDSNRDRKIKCTCINENVEFPWYVVEVPDLYDNYEAVRKFILETPALPSYEIDPSTHFPGFRSTITVPQEPLWNVVGLLLEEYFTKEWHDDYEKYLEFPFHSGIINTKMILVRHNIVTHKDWQDIGSFAGTIYLNLPDECIGGTTFYKTDTGEELLYEAKMEANKLVLYQQRIPHSIFLDPANDYKENFRITQNFFVSQKSSHIFENNIKLFY